MNYILLPLKNWLQNWTNIISQAERKAFIMILKIYAFGIDIEKNNARARAYYAASRSFELPEFKIAGRRRNNLPNSYYP